MPELPEILQALKLAPGETLIVRVSPDRHLTEEQFAHMADRLREAFDDRGMSDRNVVLIAADELAIAERTDVTEVAEPESGHQFAGLLSGGAKFFPAEHAQAGDDRG